MNNESYKFSLLKFIKDYNEDYNYNEDYIINLVKKITKESNNIDLYKILIPLIIYKISTTYLHKGILILNECKNITNYNILKYINTFFSDINTQIPDKNTTIIQYNNELITLGNLFKIQCIRSSKETLRGINTDLVFLIFSNKMNFFSPMINNRIIFPCIEMKIPIICIDINTSILKIYKLDTYILNIILQFIK